MLGANRACASCLISLAGLLGGAGGAAAQGDPEGVLKGYGLVRSDKYFVVEADPLAIDKLYKIKPLIDDVAETLDRIAQATQIREEFLYYDHWKVRFEGEIKKVNQVLPRMPRRTPLEKEAYREMVEYRDNLALELTGINTERTVRLNVLLTPEQWDRLNEEYVERRARFLEAATDVKPLVDQAVEKYHELKKDSRGRNAIQTYQQLAKTNIGLGPSKQFIVLVRAVKDAQRHCAPATVERPKSRTFNKRGKYDRLLRGKE
jgi:hypothetical protein